MSLYLTQLNRMYLGCTDGHRSRLRGDGRPVRRSNSSSTAVLYMVSMDLFDAVSRTGDCCEADFGFGVARRARVFRSQCWSSADNTEKMRTPP